MHRSPTVNTHRARASFYLTYTFHLSKCGYRTSTRTEHFSTSPPVIVLFLAHYTRCSMNFKTNGNDFMDSFWTDLWSIFSTTTMSALEVYLAKACPENSALVWSTSGRRTGRWGMSVTIECAGESMYQWSWIYLQHCEGMFGLRRCCNWLLQKRLMG